MDGNLEFQVLLYYLVAMYLFPVICWRKTRLSRAVVGVGGDRQKRSRLVAMAFFVVPLVNFAIGGPWPWFPELYLPGLLRWCATIPATLSVLLLIWACRQTIGGLGLSREQSEKWFVQGGPYKSIRHPQLLASSIFFLSLAVLSDNGVVLSSTILGVVLLRLVVAPAVDADLAEEFGNAYNVYRERTGSYWFHLRRMPKAQYTVPRRFGLSAVLTLTTIFAILFGALNYMRAHPVVYLFVSTEIAAICLVQIVFGSAARRGSAVIGAILLPFWVAITLVSERGQINPFAMEIIELIAMITAVVFLAIVGALLGYCIGTLAAGFFLAMDMLEPYLPGAKSASLNTLAAKSDQKPN